MSKKAVALFSLQLAGGANASASWQLDYDAMDRAMVTVPHGGNVTVTSYPPGATHLLMMYISASDYSGKVTYITDKIAVAAPIKQPQLLVGESVLPVTTTDGTVKFSNAGGGDAVVDVIVLRNL
jgi:hypothetical protein